MLQTIYMYYVTIHTAININYYVISVLFWFVAVIPMPCIRVANSHAYSVILTHLTCYSRTHAIDKFTHAFKKNHTHTHAILKNQKQSTIFDHCKTNCNIVFVFLL